MKCPEVRRQLFLFLDNELEVKENLEILTHLDLCQQCSEYFESEKRVEDLLKEKLTIEFDQYKLWKKVQNHLRQPSSPSPLRSKLNKWFLVWGPAVAATLLVTLGILHHFSGPEKLNAETLVNQSVQIHRKMLDGELPSKIPSNIRDDFEKTRDFLSQKVNVNICDHNLTKIGYSHREGCLASSNRIPGQRMATIIYYRGQNRLSQFIIRDPSISFPASSFRPIKGTKSHYNLFIVRPYKVIVFKEGKTLCLFVGSLKRKHVDELVEITIKKSDL
jgi:hypothetical protein